MANEPSQMSVFDDEAMIDAALRNIEIIKEKRAIDPQSLTDSEKRFLTGIAFMADMDENPIQPERLVGKKVSPFSKMMMSAADTFSRAKKAFNIWTKKEPELTREEVQQFGPPAPTLAYKMQRRYNDINNAIGDKITDVNMRMTDSISNGIHNVSTKTKDRYNAVNNAIGSKLVDINNGINNGVESVIDSVNYGANAVGGKIGDGVEAINKKIDSGIEKVSSGMADLGEFIEKKKLNITSRFMEIYDDVTVAKMKAQTAIENNVNLVKSKYLEAKTSVAAFAEKFEEPWISVSFKGQENIPSLADISYNTGLFAAKAKTKIANALSGMLDKKVKNKVEPLMASPAFAMQDNEGPSIIGSKLAEPVVAEPVVAEPVVAEPVVAEPVVAEPVVAEPVVAEPVVAEPVVAEPVVAEPVVAEPVVAELKSIKNDDIVAKFKKYQVLGKENREKRNQEALETTGGFLSSIRSLFGKQKTEEKKIPEYRGYEFETKISGDEPSQFFKDLKTGNLPSRVAVFRDTEERLKNNLGLSVAKNGGYVVVYPENIFEENVKKEHIKNNVVPHMLNELKKSSDYVFSLKEKQKNDEVLKVYDALFAKTNDDKKTIEIIKEAKSSPEVKEQLLSLGIDGMDNFVKNLDESLLKVEEHRYLTSLAEFDLAVVANAITGVKLEVVELSKKDYSALEINEKFNKTEITPNGVTAENIISVVHKKDFSAILNSPGNEDIVMRKLSSVITKNENDLALAAERKRKAEESAVMDTATGSFALDEVSAVKKGTPKFEANSVNVDEIFAQNRRDNDGVLQNMLDVSLDSNKRLQGRLAGGRLLAPGVPDPRGMFTLHTGLEKGKFLEPPKYTTNTFQNKNEAIRVTTPEAVEDVNPPQVENESISLPSSDVREKHFGSKRTLIVPENKKPKP